MKECWTSYIQKILNPVQRSFLSFAKYSSLTKNFTRKTRNSLGARKGEKRGAGGGFLKRRPTKLQLTQSLIVVKSSWTLSPQISRTSRWKREKRGGEKNRINFRERKRAPKSAAARTYFSELLESQSMETSIDERSALIKPLDGHGVSQYRVVVNACIATFIASRNWNDTARDYTR